MKLLQAAAILLTTTKVEAFTPAKSLGKIGQLKNTIQNVPRRSSTSTITNLQMMFDPFELTNIVDHASVLDSTSSLISFTDQGQNLAGVFFQASLLPYLAFLYFLGYKGNRTPALGNFGWQFLLIFVLSTIPSGIITKGTYGVSLADCDWLHGSAESL